MAISKIGAIMVTFNNVYDTICAMESLFRSDYKNFEVVVVDNNSYVQYVHILREELKMRFPSALFLHLDTDKGYGSACNAGVRHLANSGCDAFLFLNNDIILDRKCVSALAVDFTDKKTALVGPKVNHGLSGILCSAGGFIDKRTLRLTNRGNGETDKGQYDTRQEVDFINGCAFMISEKVFTEVGGFDERFYYYSEETDLCYRIMQKGYKLVYEPRAVVYHWPSTTAGVESKRAFYYRTRSRLQFVRKHTKSRYAFFYNSVYIFNELILIFTLRKIGYIIKRVIAVLMGMKDSIKRKTGEGPYR